MPKPSILSMLELAMPMRCHTSDCKHDTKVINTAFVPMNEEETFCEAFGQGGEDEETDVCPKCAMLSVLEDPYAYFFYSVYQGDVNYTVAMRMSLDFVESLARLAQNQAEDRQTHDKVFLASDATADCFDDFHVFQQGNDGDFNDEFDFDKHPFVERNKVVIVNGNGVQLSCDISTKGDNETELGTVKTAFFSVADLAVMNSWITRRVGIRSHNGD